MGQTAASAIATPPPVTAGEARVHDTVIEDDAAVHEAVCGMFAALGIEVRVLGRINRRALERVVDLLHRELAAPVDRERPMIDVAWIYDAARWTLLAPNGRAVQLSLAESQVIRCLFARNGQAVSRADLLTALNRPHLDDYARNLDVTMSRLRKKVESVCRQKLPLTAARGHGYAFSAPAKIVG